MNIGVIGTGDIGWELFAAVEQEDNPEEDEQVLGSNHGPVLRATLVSA